MFHRAADVKKYAPPPIYFESVPVQTLYEYIRYSINRIPATTAACVINHFVCWIRKKLNGLNFAGGGGPRQIYENFISL